MGKKGSLSLHRLRLPFVYLEKGKITKPIKFLDGIKSVHLSGKIFEFLGIIQNITYSCAKLTKKASLTWVNRLKT